MALYHAVQGSVGYTIVGTPTIVDGVVSGFSSSNYLELSQQANNSIPFEMVVCFAANSVTTTNNGFVICVVGDAQMYINTHSQLGVKYSTGSNKWITEPTILSANTKYWGKFTYDGTQVGISISTDGTQFTTPTTQENNPRDRAAASRFGFPYSGYQLFDGSIDLNKTYIKIDGQPWFGICPVEVQKHQIKGQVGYKVVGSPTITDGVVSDFTNSSYLSIGTYTGSSPSTLEMGVTFTTADTIRRSDSLFGRTSTVDTGLFFRGGADSIAAKYRVSYDNGNSWTNVESASSYTLSANTTYTAIMTVSNVTRELVLKIVQNGEVKDTVTTTFNESAIIENPTSIGIGKIQAHNNFTGSIYLNNTYIKVNGQLWFWQPRPTQYIVKDGKLVWVDPKLYLTGPVNYEVVGSPTIVDGVVSNFSSSNYLTLPGSVSTAQEFEIAGGINLNTSSPSGGYTPIFQSNGYGIIFCVTAAMKLGAYLSSAGNSWDLANITTFVGTTTLSANTNYLAKLKKTSTAYELWLKQGNNDWNLEATLSSTATIVSGPLRIGYGSRAFEGSIDLNNTYIKVNEQLWFYGKNYASKNIAPVPANYTYGNTTTSAIGWVDMRTQSFHEAPTGTMIEKDS